MYKEVMHMTEVSISDFRRDLKKYAEMVKQEDIIVLNNGKPIMRISDPLKDKVREMKALRGIAKTNADPADILKEKLREL